MLHVWMNAEHLKPFYMQEPISMEEIKTKFTPRVDGADSVSCLIVSHEDSAFGYVQWYLNEAFPDYGVASLGINSGISFDYFIGSTEHLGVGLGSKMLNCAAGSVLPLLDLEDQKIYVIHSNQNKVAIHCSKQAGFIEFSKMIYNDEPSTVFVR